MKEGIPHLILDSFCFAAERCNCLVIANFTSPPRGNLGRDRDHDLCRLFNLRSHLDPDENSVPSNYYPYHHDILLGCAIDAIDCSIEINSIADFAKSLKAMHSGFPID
jgi:hypothetical protein